MEIPDYIQEEIDKFIEEKKNNINRCTTIENIYAYIRLAKKVGRITDAEANKIFEFVRKL